MRGVTYTGAGLGTLMAVWLIQGALRGHHAGTIPTPLLAAALVVAACLLTLAVGLVVIDRRPPVRKAPRR